jgi:hypothetical protein
MYIRILNRTSVQIHSGRLGKLCVLHEDCDYSLRAKSIWERIKISA